MGRIGWFFVAFFVCHGAIAYAGEMRSETFRSGALAREMPYVIYLPDGYQSGREDYPVLYLLHGAGGDERSWAERGHIKDKADALIASGVIPPTIIVMPGCPACWWVDGAKDKAETAFWSDLVPTIAIRYRTIEARGGRLVAGLSAGGYGAIRYALRYPDRIAAAAALSPAVYSDIVPASSAARTQPPFLSADGSFNQAAWDSKNYPALLNRYFAQPARVPFYLVSGDKDKLGIALETTQFFERIYGRQPDQVELRIVSGDHSWKVWEFAIEDAMKYIFKFAEKPKPAPRTAAAKQSVIPAEPISANR